MTEIDKSKIRVGDDVKIEYDGLVSPDWTEVVNRLGNKFVGKYFLGWDSVTVTDHRPNFKGLERDVETARNALVAAEAALAIAKNDSNTFFRFKVGDRVRLSTGHITTIEACGDAAYPYAYRVSSGGLHYDISQIDRWNP